MFGSPPPNSISKTKFSVKKHAAMPPDRLFGVIVGTFLHSLLDIQGNMTPGDFEYEEKKEDDTEIENKTWKNLLEFYEGSKIQMNIYISSIQW